LLPLLFIFLSAPLVLWFSYIKERKPRSSQYPISASPTFRIKCIYGNKSTNTANYHWGLRDFIFLAGVSKTQLGNLIYMSHIHQKTTLVKQCSLHPFTTEHFFQNFFFAEKCVFFICAPESTERILIHKSNFKKNLEIYTSYTPIHCYFLFSLWH
jgi:hypothetical protein